MRTFVILVACYLTYLPLFAATETFTWVVHFETDVDTPGAGESALLRGFLADFTARDDLRITIVGHADLRGTNAYNHDLADRRCKAVWEIVSNSGLCFTSSTLEVKGEESPLVRGLNADALQQNRRVEITVQRVSFADLDEVHKALTEPYINEFRGESTELNRFICANQSTITFPADALCDANGVPYTGQYTLEVIEALDPLAFFASKLSTESDGEILVSGGMMKLEAFTDDGDPLFVQEGSALQVTLPTVDFDPTMTLFVSANGANWMNTGQAPSTRLTSVEYRQLPEERNCPIWVAPRPLVAPDKPVRPILTPRPSPPQVLTYEATPRKYPWWRPRKRKQQLERQEAILRVYAKRNEKAFKRYERHLRRYEIDSAGFETRLEVYQNRIRAWEAKCDSINRANERAIANSLVRFKESTYECYEQRRNEAAQWLALRDSLRQASINNAAINAPSVYAFNVTGFGWLNCDRFYGTPQREMVEYVVQLEPGVQTTTVVVFDDTNSILSIYPDERGKAKARIPRTAKARIVSIYVKDKRVLVASQTLANERRYTLEYATSPLEELGDVFKQAVNKEGMAMAE